MRRRRRDGLLGEPDHKRVSAVVTIEEGLAERAPVAPFDAGRVAEARERGDFEAVEAEIARVLRAPWHPDAQCWVEPAIRVVHNPHANRPLDDDAFAPFARLVMRGDAEMIWTDRGE